MADRWYYLHDGLTLGPVTDAEIQRLATAGQLHPTDSIWAEGEGASSASPAQALVRFPALVTPPASAPEWLGDVQAAEQPIGRRSAIPPAGVPDWIEDVRRAQQTAPSRIASGTAPPGQRVVASAESARGRAAIMQDPSPLVAGPRWNSPVAIAALLTTAIVVLSGLAITAGFLLMIRLKTAGVENLMNRDQADEPTKESSALAKSPSEGKDPQVGNGGRLQPDAERERGQVGSKIFPGKAPALPPPAPAKKEPGSVQVKPPESRQPEAGPAKDNRKTRLSSLIAKPGWELVFSDEFDGQALDSTKWNRKDPWGKERNHELQGYVPDAFRVGQGILHIQAEKRSAVYDGKRRPYASGMLTTYGKFRQQYGLFEIRCRVPRGRGLWPAFWLLPEPLGWPPEIDVLEILGHETNKVYMTHHWNDGNQHHQMHGSTWVGPDFADDFHVFAVEWHRYCIVWLVDGVERFRSTQHIPKRNMYLPVNLAVGGDMPGNPDAATPFPSSFDVDYVRVYRKAKAGKARSGLPPKAR